MKTIVSLPLLLLAACSQTPSLSSLKASDNARATCAQGQEETSFSLSADKDLQKLIKDKHLDPNYGVSFEKSGLLEMAQHSGSGGRIFNDINAAENEVILNVCFDQATDQVTSLLSADVTLYGVPMTLHKFLKAEGLTEAVFGNFEKLQIMGSPSERPDYVFLMEGSKAYSAAAAIWAKSTAQGIKYFTGIEAAMTNGHTEAVVGTLELREKTKDDGCIGDFYLSDNVVHLGLLDMKMKTCMGRGEVDSVGYRVMSLEVTDNAVNPPLHFIIEGGRRAINDEGFDVLYAKDDESISVTSGWIHHNEGDTFLVVHPQLEIELTNGVAIRRKDGTEDETADLLQPHFIMGIHYPPRFSQEMVSKHLVSAQEIDSDWLDLYLNGVQKICFNDTNGLFEDAAGARDLPKLSEAARSSHTFDQALKVATADQSAQILSIVKDADIHQGDNDYNQLSIVYRNAQSVEARLPIMGCSKTSKEKKQE